MKLLPHQDDDARDMAEGNDIPNFSEAGTGKTLSTLGAVKYAGIDGGLVLAPPIALPMWKEEIENFLGVEANIIRSGKSPVRGDVPFHIMSYGLAANRDLQVEIAQAVSKMESNCLIMDESHALKTPGAARTQAVFGPDCRGPGGLVEYFDKAWALTGTPIMRHADDIWSQIRATHSDVLAKYGVLTNEQFRHRYCVQQVRKLHPRARPQLVVVGSQRMEELNRLLYKDVRAIRRTMDEVKADMPPLSFRNVYVPLKRDPELTAAMRHVDLNNLVENDVHLATAMRLLGRGKVEGCVEYLAELSHPVLLGYWHTDVGDAAENMLRKAGKVVARVMGGTSSREKESIRRQFNAGLIDVLVGQIGAMNVSWNLQEAGHHVVILEDNFSPGMVEQFIKRVWRFGQGNHVQVDFIKAEHDLDDAIRKTRETKQHNAAAITDVSPHRGKGD